MHPESNQAVVGAIPARYASQRLPGKILRPLAGRPMIEHVYRRSQDAKGLDRVVILTDDQRIVDAAVAFGAECELTPVDCASGTDRVAWAARSWDALAVVNIQGDEPLIDPAAITQLASHLTEHPEDAVVTLAAPAGPEDMDDPDTVKVVIDSAGYALYFSRSPIPYRRGAGGPAPLRHVGIYGYQRSTLLELAELEPTPLELAESLEQLRALENGIAIRVLETDGEWWGVDTMKDLERTEEYLRENASDDGGGAPRSQVETSGPKRD